MNSVSLIGRLTRDPEVRYTNEGLAIAQMLVAIDRGQDLTRTRTATKSTRPTSLLTESSSLKGYSRHSRATHIASSLRHTRAVTASLGRGLR